MDQLVERTLKQIPSTMRGHFVINLYGAVYHLLSYIHRLEEVGGASLDEVFKRFPFLAHYFTEMQRYMPEDITWEDGIDWWQTEIDAWEEDCQMHLPLRALSQKQGFSFASRMAFMLIGLVEEDSRFGTLLAELQAPLQHRYPTLELVGSAVIGNGISRAQTDAWTLGRELIEKGFVECINPQAARSEWVLRIPSLLWDAARGEFAERPVPGYRYQSPDAFTSIDRLIFPAEFIQRLDNLSGLVQSGKVQAIIVRGDPGCDPVEVLGALARRMDCGLLILDGSSGKDENHFKQLGPFCTMNRSIPVLRYELGPGETAELPSLTLYSGVIGVILGHEGGITGDPIKNSVTLSLPMPNRHLRQQQWRLALNGQEIDDLDTIAETFQIAGGYIRQVARMAGAQAGLDGRETICLTDVREASRALNRQHLDSLADHLDTHGSWQDLAATETTTGKLLELEQRCRHRERLLDHLGPAFRNNANRGVRALFTGMSGTGKTLAARILAAELGMDLYRVDLAAVINKYIGETEKNLHRVLSRAESLDIVLLLDEGDALLGSRTEVKSANDRYANLETNYLLQRLENYQGIVVVTTNLSENIDRAFQRRMDIVVPFFSPQIEERWQILQIHLPIDHQVEPDFLQQVALRCELTGGQIRNAALHAALLALDGDSPVLTHHLDEALRSEYRKAGGTFPLNNGDTNIAGQDSGMDAFIAALQATQY